MKLHHLFAFSLGIAGIGMAASLPASAAVSVVGTGLGQACYRTAEFGGNPTEGIATCTTALTQEALTISDRASTFINRGILRAREGDPEGAIRDYDTGLGIKADLAEGYVDRGASYLALKHYKEALTDIDKGLSMNVNRPHIAYYDRAIAHEALGDIRAAYEDYKKAVELAPDFTLAKEQLQRFKVVRKPAANGT